ncbi:MAG TPA: hypothetical protein VFK17_07930 [Gaiellaceae bacterium]|nr:hypothetical protein [Gaiellaceae bacterium]
MDLERDLRALAAEVDWPATPRAVLSPPAGAATPRRAGRRRHAAVAVAAVAVAAAAALAVPQSRGAILRVLHLGAASVRLVERLPAAQERSLASGLGPVASERDARAALGGELLLPPLSPQPPLHLGGGRVVSLLLVDRGEPVLLSELYTPGAGAPILKKLASGQTRVEAVEVGRDPGLWLAGRPHLFLAPGAPPRLAGDVLLWTHGDLTLRLEGRGLTLARATELAEALR